MEPIIVNDTTQSFLGENFYLCGNYFQRNGKRLHIAVWTHHNGEIPKGFHVHHKDRNRANNSIGNLELLPASVHMALHQEGRCLEFSDNARKAAAEWHGSDEGREWHKQQYKKHCAAALSKRVLRKCLCCGKEFPGKSFSKFCSNNCKSKYRRLTGADLETRWCVVCGAEFSTNRYGKTKTCSKQCANISESKTKGSKR